jgi:putative autotransporter adhesin-like protein
MQLENTLSLITNIKNPSKPIRVTVTMPSLISLDVRNTDDIEIQGFTEAVMRLKNDGRNEMAAFINVDSLILIQDGRGEINIRGTGKYLKADLNNRGKIDTERFSVNTAEIKAKEYSKASIAVSETVWITNDGSCRINIEGEPKIIKTNNKNID